MMIATAITATDRGTCAHGGRARQRRYGSGASGGRLAADTIANPSDIGRLGSEPETHVVAANAGLTSRLPHGFAKGVTPCRIRWKTKPIMCWSITPDIDGTVQTTLPDALPAQIRL